MSNYVSQRKYNLLFVHDTSLSLHPELINDDRKENFEKENYISHTFVTLCNLHFMKGGYGCRTEQTGRMGTRIKRGTDTRIRRGQVMGKQRGTDMSRISSREFSFLLVGEGPIGRMNYERAVIYIFWSLLGPCIYGIYSKAFTSPSCYYSFYVHSDHSKMLNAQQLM